MSFNREAINTFRDSAKWMKHLEERLDKLAERLSMNDQTIEAACKGIVKLEKAVYVSIADDLDKSFQPGKSADSKPIPDGWTFTFFMPAYALDPDKDIDYRIGSRETISYKAEPYYNEDKDGDDEE